MNKALHIINKVRDLQNSKSDIFASLDLHVPLRELCTSFCCVGVFKKGKVEIISNDQGNRKTPYVAFTDTNYLVGESARDQIARNPSNTVFDAKSLVGCRLDDAKVV